MWIRRHAGTLQLDIKYLYKDMGTVARPEQAINLTAEMLSEFPPKLIQGLRDSILTQDREAIFAVIERIESMPPDTAKSLQHLWVIFK